MSKRYALLYDPPWGGTALLVLFPAGGGDHVRPEAVLELWPLPLPQPRFPGNAGFRPTCPWSPPATSKSVAVRTRLRWASRGSTGARTGRSIPTAPTT
ncbi:hypothetical protein E4K10_21565 [Streptomyces sp. T1317-0309]|nr:hypothetical protein E4K10_21565 [Streptomyces sp. T1317-0309]